MKSRETLFLLILLIAVASFYQKTRNYPSSGTTVSSFQNSIYNFYGKGGLKWDSMAKIECLAEIIKQMSPALPTRNCGADSREGQSARIQNQLTELELRSSSAQKKNCFCWTVISNELMNPNSAVKRVQGTIKP